MAYFDVVLFRWLNSWAGVSPFFDWVIVFRATYLWYIVMLAVLAFFVATFFVRFRGLRKRNAELIIFTFISSFISRFIVTEIIRFFYHRPRPFEVLYNVTQLVHNGVLSFVDNTKSGFFPSGHASLAFAVATAVAFYYPKTSVLFFLAAVAIGAGRVSAGVHWPSDILGGAVVGIVTTLLVGYIYKKTTA